MRPPAAAPGPPAITFAKLAFWAGLGLAGAVWTAGWLAPPCGPGESLERSALTGLPVCLPFPPAARRPSGHRLAAEQR